MGRTTRLLAALGATAMLLTAMVGPVAAKDGEIIRRGSCSGTATWKLKAAPDNGRIEVEFEVDTTRIGRQWRVRITDNGEVIFRGFRTTLAPSGSFSVELRTPNRAGSDRFVARARNLVNGQVCVGVLTF
jgi:hypothetical protein